MIALGDAPATAIVHDPDGVRFLATAEGGDILLAQLADYVRGRCDDMLWADEAREVHRLFDEGELGAGVALYFDHTGERWDRERLTLLTPRAGRSGRAHEERSADARR